MEKSPQVDLKPHKMKQQRGHPIDLDPTHPYRFPESLIKIRQKTKVENERDKDLHLRSSICEWKELMGASFRCTEEKPKQRRSAGGAGS